MKRTKTKKSMAFLLVLIMVLSLLPAMALTAAAANDPLALPAVPTAAISVTANGQNISVNAWEDVVYVAKPIDIHFHFPPIPSNPAIDTTQKLNIYVPKTVSATSPVILYVDNGGWFTNTKPIKLNNGDALPSNNSKTAAIGEALNAGYVIVTYSCRGRNDSPNNGEFLGHSPATMTDTKAVIRYLRYNDAVIPGDSEKIVVTGTSGGGALTSILAASGNSPDYYASLYKIGAAGMTGATTSTISDAVFAAITYCPITDLPHADQAYEWVYGPIRQEYASDKLTLDQVNPKPGMGTPTDVAQVYGEKVLAASNVLADDYAAYIDSLGLKDDNGKLLKASDGSFKAAIKGLLEKGVEKEFASAFPSSDMVPVAGTYDWLAIWNGKATIDWDAYLYWIGTKQTGLKTAPAFSNKGTPNEAQLNEDNIFGTTTQAYSPFELWSWNNNAEAGNGVGKDDTGLDWDAYLQTDAGKALTQQMKMTNPIPYLQSAKDGDSAPYWYVRHGMADRDTSFAVEATLYYALINDDNVKNVNFNFAWLKPHSGDYDVKEAYAWLAGVLKAEGHCPFTDINKNDWFFSDVTYAYGLDLIAGITATTYAPDSRATYAEVVKLAACMHQQYTTGAVTLQSGTPWYQNYVDYAKAVGIISKDYNWSAVASRAGCIEILANALPEAAFARINTIPDGAIPDVSMSRAGAAAIYKLYRTGIIQGADGAHNCYPDSIISRSEVAAILTRMMDSAARISFSM